MSAKRELHFFLGANTPNGFYSLYDRLYLPDRHLYIIKGGPGCGKSSFMRKIAAEVSKCGYLTEYIHCSGDPDSLDAVCFPELGVSYADGTAPHVLEPRCPGAGQSYIDLGSFYDLTALAPHREDMEALIKRGSGAYARAYSLLKASCAVGALPCPGEETVSAVLKRADGFIRREIRRNTDSPAPSLTERFLDAVTCRGHIVLFQTAHALAEKIFVLDGTPELSSLFLDRIAAASLERGWKVVRCPSPLAPAKTGHVLLPELKLGFISDSEPGSRCRHIRLASLARRHGDLPLPPPLRRLSAALMSDAESAFSEAKKIHDELEALYNPHVDFKGVYELASRHTAALLKAAEPAGSLLDNPEDIC